MTKIYLLVNLLLLSLSNYAQISLTTTGTAYTEDFNSMGTSATASLPNGFKIGADWNSGATATTQAAGTTGTGTLTTTSSGGAYNFATGVTATSIDRALGFLSSGSYLSPRSVVVKITNNTPGPITDLSISFDYEKYRSNTRAFDWLFFHGNTSAPATAESTGNQSYGSDAANVVLNPPTDITKSISLSGLSIAVGTDYYLRWTYTGSGGSSNAQALGIDNFSITAGGTPLTPCAEPASQPTSLTFTSITANSITGSFTAAPADKYLVVRSVSNTLSATPADGTVYSTGSAFGGGTIIANSSSLSFTDNGLNATTQYFYFVYSFNDAGCSGGPNYNTAAPLQGNATTTAVPACITPGTPTTLLLTPANTSVSGSFTGSGASKYLVLISTANSLSSSPANGTVYTAGQSIGNGTVVSYTSGTGFSATGLTPATQYYFYIFGANDACTGQPVYSTLSLDGTATTTNNPTGIPTGYYDAATGLSCAPLKTALSNIITDGPATDPDGAGPAIDPDLHTQNNYGGLDNVEFLTTDDRLNDAGTATIIWDMYSDNPNGPEPYTFTFSSGFDATGPEGTGWNKEHSFPQSWFGGGTSSFQGADLFHIYPTDKFVNALRANYPFGVVATATNTTLNGSKLGNSAINFPGYSGPVFEPIDAYKGDFARSTLYMVTRYQAQQPAWESLSTEGNVVMDGLTYPSVEIDYLQMLINWHNADPVSIKELDRNNEVYGYQQNRNPFIDHPEYVGAIWSATCGLALPILLTEFTAVKAGDKILLKWKAENPSDFSHFEVERSTDGINFYKIATVAPGTGILYNYSDVDLPKASILYYRLKSVDNNGTYKNSKIEAVRTGNFITAAVVYPNPTRDIANVRLSEYLQQSGTLQVLDLTGRIVRVQLVKSGDLNIGLDVNNLTAGRYFIKIITGKEVINESFVVIK